MGTRRIEVRARVAPALRLALVGALLALALAPLPAGAFCPPGRQFFDEVLGRCRDCSACPEPGHIVLRPCHVHQDTMCGPVNRLEVERAWARARADTAPVSANAVTVPPSPPSPSPPSSSSPRPRTRDRWHRRKGGRWSSTFSSSSASSSESSSWSSVVNGNGSAHRETSSSRRSHKLWHRTNSSSGDESFKQHHKRMREYVLHHKHDHNHKHHNHHNHHHHHLHHPHRQKARPPESAAQLLGAETPAGARAAGSPPMPPPSPSPGTPALPSPAPARPSHLREPFSAAEAFAWDWQAAALVAAVSGCALFFGAAALHGLRQLRKDSARSADADNLSATLSLMVPELTNDIPDNCTGDGCNSNQCLYMEQLLVRKHEEPKEGQGNVYIDRGNSRMHV